MLGPVELAIDGHAVPIRSSLQRTLLALLLTEANRAVSVDRIVDALWGDDGWEAGQQRLWFHVSKLRSRLGGGDATVQRSGSGYRLLVSDDRIDAHRFAQLIDEARAHVDEHPAEASSLARRALALWRGTPYEDVPDDVVGRAERVRLEELRLRGVELSIEAEIRRGRTEGVVPELERLIVDHPYRESFRVQLMRALAAEQRHAEALAAFATTRALFTDELGVEPSAALRGLAATIAATDAPPADARPTTTPSRRPRYGADTFVGRADELAHLLGAVRSSLLDGPTLRTVQGQAGAGKTSLLRTFVACAETQFTDLIGIHASCQAGTGPLDAFGPFRDVARRLDGDGSAAPAQMTTDVGARRLAGIAPLPPLAGAALDAMTRRSQPAAGAVADQLRQLVNALAGAAPLLLVIDDVHWADSASVDLLRRLVAQVDRRLAIVAAYRRHELRDDQVQQLEREVQSRTSTRVVIDLDRVPAERRRAFVDELLDREPNTFDAAFRRLVTRHSEGHALFAVELIDELRRRGTIRRRGGAPWEHVDADAQDTWPARVHAVLESRFARVDDSVMAVLRAASVEGEAFNTAVVADVVDRPETQVIHDLSRHAASEHEVVAAIGPDRIGRRTVYRYRFRHNLFQRFVYDSLDRVERAALHGGVAASLRALTADSDDDEWAVTLARHHELAGDTEQAVRELGRATQRAIRLAANEHAVTHVEHALRLLRQLPAGAARDELEADLHMQWGLARSILEGFSAAPVERIFERSAALLARGTSERRFPTLFGLWMNAAARADMVRSGELVAELTAAADRANDDDLRVMALHARWTDRLFFGDLAGCLAAVDAGRALYRHERHHPLCYRYGSHDAAVCGSSLGAVAAALTGDVVRAQRLLADGLALAHVLDHHPSRVQALALASWVPHLSGDPDATVAAADRVLALEAEGPLPLWFGLARFVRGWTLTVHNHDQGAIAVMERELATQREMRTHSWMPLYASLLADAYTAVERPDDARRVAALGHDAGRPFYQSELTRVRAEADAAMGHTDAGLEGLQRSVHEALQSGALVLALRSALSLARLSPTVGRANLVSVLARLPAGHRSADRSEAGRLLSR